MDSQLNTGSRSQLDNPDDKTSLRYLGIGDKCPERIEQPSAIFGGRPSWSKSFGSHASSTEMEPSYAKDQPGEEASELARVWRVYLDEAAKFDTSLTDGCNRGIDVLLVFTGLFSAVLTTFIIQSLQLLIPDSGATTNALLEQLITMQNGTVVSQPKSSTSTLQMQWVNGLWFAALACSLSTALISMLAKQWLQIYTPNTSGSPRQRARQRQSRFMQLTSWHVLAVINALPLLLHVALLLFFAGILVLLWSLDLAIMIATWIIVTFAYAFYFTSIWLPVIYPDCPYQHPISDHLRQWVLSFRIPTTDFPSADFLTSLATPVSPVENEEVLQPIRPIATPDDNLDASALVWLFTHSTDKDVVTTALQAIAGFPRDFSAVHILQEADALRLVEKGFQTCFDKDTTIDLKWHLTDAESALLYCKAWMNLTRGTLTKWPSELEQPLAILQGLGSSEPDMAAIASCLVAVSSVESHMAHWELIAHLSRYLAGEVQLSHSTLTWLLDSLIEALVQWIMPMAVIEKTRKEAVPVLLRILQLTEGMPTSNVRSAAGLALYVVTCGSVDLNHYRSEDKRRSNYCEDLLTALSTIAVQPEHFGVDETLLETTTKELARLAAPVISQSERFSLQSKEFARSTLLHLFKARRLSIGTAPDAVLVDVLRLLHPIRISPEHHPPLVMALIELLLRSSNPDITGFSVLMLQPLLSNCSITVVEAFLESNGLNILIRVAKSGDIDNSRLQLNSWKTLHRFINSSITLYEESAESLHTQLFDSIFQSELFETVFAVIASRCLWLLEHSGWIPTLLTICRLWPHEMVWRKLVLVVHETNGKYGEDPGLCALLDKFEAIVPRNKSRGPLEVDVTLDDYDDIPSIRTISTMSMAAQRVTVRPMQPMEVIEDDESKQSNIEPVFF